MSSQFIGVLIISTTDHGFGLLVLISSLRKTKNSLKNWRIGADLEIIGNMIRQSLKQLFEACLPMEMVIVNIKVHEKR